MIKTQQSAHQLTHKSTQMQCCHLCVGNVLVVSFKELIYCCWRNIFVCKYLFGNHLCYSSVCGGKSSGSVSEADLPPSPTCTGHNCLQPQAIFEDKYFFTIVSKLKQYLRTNISSQFSPTSSYIWQQIFNFGGRKYLPHPMWIVDIKEAVHLLRQPGKKERVWRWVVMVEGEK